MELQEMRQSSSERTHTATASPAPNPNPREAHPAQHKQSNPVSKWWNTWIARTITHGPSIQGGDPRDYLALERTFLGWVRTSLALISLAVVVAQLFILKDLDSSKGVVLGCFLTGGGMAIVVGAAVRYFRAQELLVKGKALTGGWEAVGLWLLLVGVLGVLFVMVLVEM